MAKKGDVGFSKTRAGLLILSVMVVILLVRSQSMLSAMAKGKSSAMQTAAFLREMERDAVHSKELQGAQKRLEAFQDESGERVAALEKSLAIATAECSHTRYIPCMLCECTFVRTLYLCVFLCVCLHARIRMRYICVRVYDCMNVFVSIYMPPFSHPTKECGDFACVRRRFHPE
jgi:hypothetical protein